MAESPAIKLLKTIKTNKQLREANATLRNPTFTPIDIEPFISDWVESVEERWQELERVLVNEIGPAIRPEQDYDEGC
jgi:hypothetical protein